MRYLAWAGVFVAGLVAQWAWGTYFAVWGLAPQVLVVLSVAVAARTGPAIGQCFAFPWGLALDLAGSRVFGANALALTVMGYLIGNARRQMDVSDPVSQAMVVAVVSLARMAFLALAGLVFEGHVFWVGWKAFLLLPIFNALVAPIGFAIVQHYVRP